MKRLLLLLMIALIAMGLTACSASRAFERGERYAKHGDWDLAVKEYRDANRYNPEDIEYRSALIRAQETAANHHYNKARNLLKERKLDAAIVELQQAVYLNPTNVAIQSTLKSVLDMKQAEEHYRAALTLQDLGKLSEATNEVTTAANLDPENVKYHDFLKKLQKKKAEAEPEETFALASEKPITLNFKNTNIKDVFDFLSKLSGVNILFDEEVKAQPVTIFVKDVSFQHALNLLLSTNKLFMKKISTDTIIIVPKSKNKMDQYQDLIVKTFYINNAKAKDIVNLLKSMVDVKKVYVNDAANSITVRDNPEKIKLLEKMIAANDLKEAEVILDVEILEIARTNKLNYGWNFTPSMSASAAIQGLAAASGGGAIALSELMHLTKDNVFVSIPGIVVNLIKKDSDAQTLANPRVRVLNNKIAKFHIGDKIPVQSATVTATATTTGTITSTFEYKDIGIKLNIEPVVHLNNTVTLKMSMEISTLGDALDFGNGQKQYKFGTRNTETIINLRDGEAVIIGGLIKDEERKSKIKVPLLGEIPAVGKLFSSTDDETLKTDILMSITPNIVRAMELPDKDTQMFWSGTEEAYDTKPLFISSATKTSKSTSKPVDKSAVLESMAKPNPKSSMTPEASKPLSSPSTTSNAGAAPVPIPPVSAPTVTGQQRPEAPKESPPVVSAPTATGQQSSGPVLELKPSESASQVGQEARFEITAAEMQSLYGAILTLSYDPKILEFKIANEGTLLKKDGQQTSFLFSNNVKAGTVDIYMTRIGDVGGISGSGSLCTLVFQGKTGGASDVGIKSMKLTNFKREQIKSDVKGAKVVVK